MTLNGERMDHRSQTSHMNLSSSRFD